MLQAIAHLRKRVFLQVAPDRDAVMQLERHRRSTWKLERGRRVHGQLVGGRVALPEKMRASVSSKPNALATRMEAWLSPAVT